MLTDCRLQLRKLLEWTYWKGIKNVSLIHIKYISHSCTSCKSAGHNSNCNDRFSYSNVSADAPTFEEFTRLSLACHQEILGTNYYTTFHIYDVHGTANSPQNKRCQPSSRRTSTAYSKASFACSMGELNLICWKNSMSKQTLIHI